MAKKWRIPVLILLAVIAAGGVAAYLFTVGPFGTSVLATVNGEKITLSGFQQELERIDPPYRDMVRENPEKLLEIIINRTLLLQQAKKEDVTLPSGMTPAAGSEEETIALIEAYFGKMAATLPPVTAAEIDEVYVAYKDRLEGRTKEEAAPLIVRLIEQQRQGEQVDRLIDELRKAARIDVNRKALQKLAGVAPAAAAEVTPDLETQSEEDFRKALADGRPTLVDFGSNSCIPCRELRPVLEKIRKDFAEKMEVLIIDVQKYRKLAGEYQIQVIPTVIFFDAAGKEVSRHQGFMTEARIKEQLVKLGLV
jgi:thioredoxin 1